MARVHWSEEAENDIRRLIGHIARDSHALTRKWAHRIRKSDNVLKHHPEIGSPVEDISRTGYRELIVGNYRVLYRYDGRTCLVSMVVQAEKIYLGLLKRKVRCD